MSDSTLLITRDFQAPQSQVWAALSEQDRLAQWWGPKGFEWLGSKLDFRPGGSFLYHMKAPAEAGGGEMWGKFAYDEIDPQTRIVFRSGFSNAAAEFVRPPFSELFPIEIANLWTLEEVDGGATRLTLRGTPHNATDKEHEFFAGMLGNMQQGFAGTLHQLEEYLARA